MASSAALLRMRIYANRVVAKLFSMLNQSFQYDIMGKAHLRWVFASLMFIVVFGLWPGVRVAIFQPCHKKKYFENVIVSLY